MALSSNTDATAKLDEPQAQALATCFAKYLNDARNTPDFMTVRRAGSCCPETSQARPVLTFAPLPATDTTPRRSLIREMERRFEGLQIPSDPPPFFRDHFSRIDRQIVLVDALGAIHNGPQAVEDMRGAMTEILSAFRPGKNAFLSNLLRGQTGRKNPVCRDQSRSFAPQQHPQLTAIMQALTRDAQDRAKFAGAQTAAMAIASLRATTEDTVTHAGAELDVVRGILADTGKAAAFYPGALPEDPNHLLGPAREGGGGMAGSGLSR